jgi:hypothetical protein
MKVLVDEAKEGLRFVKCRMVLEEKKICVLIMRVN